MTAANCVDLVLAVVVAEAAGLLLLHRATGRGPAPAAALPNLLAGFMLLLALRFGLAGAGLPAMGACLAAAGLAHVVDLRHRWRA